MIEIDLRVSVWNVKTIRNIYFSKTVTLPAIPNKGFAVIIESENSDGGNKYTVDEVVMYDGEKEIVCFVQSEENSVEHFKALSWKMIDA